MQAYEYQSLWRKPTNTSIHKVFLKLQDYKQTEEMWERNIKHKHFIRVNILHILCLCLPGTLLISEEHFHALPSNPFDHLGQKGNAIIYKHHLKYAGWVRTDSLRIRGLSFVTWGHDCWLRRCSPSQIQAPRFSHLAHHHWGHYLGSLGWP